MFKQSFLKKLTVLVATVATVLATGVSVNAAPVAVTQPDLVLAPSFINDTSGTWTSNLREHSSAGTAEYKGKLYFEIYNYQTEARELARLGSNGVIERMIDNGVPYRPFGPMTVFNGFLFFSAYDPILENIYLFRFDGTTAVRVSDYRFVSGMMHIAEMGGELYMIAFDENSLKLGIYKLVNNISTVKVVDLETAGITFFGHYLVPFNGYLYFLANDANGYRKYFKFDGNVITKAFDLSEGHDFSATGLIKPVVFNEKLYFSGTGKTGENQETFFLYSLDKAGSLRTFKNSDSTSGVTAIFGLFPFGKYLYGVYNSIAAEGQAYFRFDGKKFERIIGAKGFASTSSLAVLNGNLYTLSGESSNENEIVVIEGLVATPVTDLNPGTFSQVLYNTPLLPYRGQLIYAAKSGDTTMSTVRLRVDPRLNLTLKNGKLSASQVKSVKAFLKANKSYKVATCTVTGAVLGTSAKQAKSLCGSVTAGTKFKKRSSGKVGVSANFGLNLVLTK